MLAVIHWGPDPVAFSIGSFPIAWYGILFACAFVAAYMYMQRLYQAELKPQKDLDNLAMWIILGTIVGARLGHMLFYDYDALLANPISLFYIRDGGLASHGAGIVLLLVMWRWGRKHPDQPFLWVLDRYGIVVMLAGFFIRLGNFVNGEIYGYPTDLPWAVSFDGPKVPTTDRLIPRHPSMLYEAFTVLAFFFVLHWVYRRWGRHWQLGRMGGLFLILLFTSRFLIEFTKLEQAEHGTGLLLNTGQLLSIPFVALGVWLMLRKSSYPPAVPAKST